MKKGDKLLDTALFGKAIRVDSIDLIDPFVANVKNGVWKKQTRQFVTF